ncbi:Thymidylate kinase [compost metagenome]
MVKLTRDPAPPPKWWRDNYVIGRRKTHPHPGRFITFEGPDGSGKTSNIKLLESVLKELGYTVVLSREPGGTDVAEKLRSIILGDPVGPKCELLLFAAARSNHVETKIMPALKNGWIVISDRFADSSYAYQGKARGMMDDVLMLEKYVLEGFQPDYTLFFDVTLEESTRRLLTRFGDAGENNHFDQEVSDFKAKVYQGYQERYIDNPNRMVRIDAMQSLPDVARDVEKWARETFPPKLPPSGS